MFHFQRSAVSGGKKKQSVLLISNSAQITQLLRNVAHERSPLQLTTEKLGSPALPALLQASDVVVFDVDSSPGEHAVDLQTLTQTKPAAVPLVALSSTIDDELVRSFLRLRVADWIKIPATPHEVEVCLSRALRRGDHPPTKARCLTFVGAKGGVGTTTMAVTAALIMQKRMGGAGGVCLVDLDFENACCADFLDLPTGWQVKEMQEDPSRMDERILGSMLAAHANGIEVLAGKSAFLQGDRLDEDVVVRPLELASQKYAGLVVDIPRSGLRWLENVVPGTTDFYIVTEFTVPGLKAAKAMLDKMKETAPAAVPRVIVNKYRRSLFGSNLTLGEAKELLGESLAGAIPDDPKLVLESINRGVPLTEIKSMNSISSGLAQILDLQAAKPATAKGTA
ncbi:MAG: hypothetical protein KGO53_00980 [Alphaproteobacteria bacterium]|nr:hypothetical protein [Alphaproteobacteria bacterium]